MLTGCGYGQVNKLEALNVTKSYETRMTNGIVYGWLSQIITNT